MERYLRPRRRPIRVCRVGSRARGLAVAAWVLAALGALPAVGADPVAESISVELEVEQTLLNEDLRKFRTLALRRDESEAIVAQLQQALDVAVADQKASETGRLDQLIEQVSRAVAERDTLWVTERHVVERISERHQRIALLSRELERLDAADDDAPRGALAGTWDLVLLPVEQRGTCKLRQDGAVINGTYELSGGWTGSLQGTLVDRKVFLLRIDSKLGKMMEFEGYLSSDGQRITGTWLNYELAGGDGSTGQFTARRRAD